MSDESDHLPPGSRPRPGGWFQPNTQEEAFGIMLARIDERTKNTAADVTELKRTVGEQYVGRQEFKNLSDKVALHQKILFTTIGGICLSVLGAVLALVVQRGGN